MKTAQSDTLLKLWLDTMNLGHFSSKFTDFSESSENLKDFEETENTQNSQSIPLKAKKVIETKVSASITSPQIIINKAPAPESDIDSPLVQTARQLASKVQTLSELYDTLKDFEGCTLKQTSTNTVVFDGIANSDVMLIGEAPGSQEDEKGIPFCGDSGKLLDLILQSIGLSRKTNVYITNTVFWRPPANRRPTDLEVAICKPFLEKHIFLIKPKLLILVGSTSLNALLGKEKSITKVRRNYYEYTNTYLKDPLIATAIFHPAYLLRQPIKKKDTWFDMLEIKKFLHSVCNK